MSHHNGVIDRLITDARALDYVRSAITNLRECATNVQPGDPQVNMQHQLADDANALLTLTEAFMLQVRRRVYDRAEQAGRLVAREIIEPILRELPSEQPIVWLTGNSYMPPIRDIPAAERMWELTNDIDSDTGAMVWELFMQAVDHECANREIEIAAPEHDNALYVVDLRRWERKDANEEDVGDDMNDEWRPVEGAE